MLSSGFDKNSTLSNLYMREDCITFPRKTWKKSFIETKSSGSIADGVSIFHLITMLVQARDVEAGRRPDNIIIEDLTCHKTIASMPNNMLFYVISPHHVLLTQKVYLITPSSSAHEEGKEMITPKRSVI